MSAPDPILQRARALNAKIDRLPPDHPAVRLRTLLTTAPGNGTAAASPQALELDDDYWLDVEDAEDTRATPPTRPKAGGFRFIPLSTVQPEAVHWLWPARVAFGKLTLLIGDPGLGKSQLSLDLAARVTRGMQLPTGEPVAPGVVIVLSAEDGAADTVRPRFDAAGGDAARLSLEDGCDADLVRGLADLRAEIQRTSASLVIVDPLTAYLPSEVNAWRDTDVRGVLRPLAKLAEQTGVAVLAIMHPNKKSDAPALYRVGGSIAFTAGARVVLLVARDDTDGSTVLAGLKSNLAPLPLSLSFQIVEHGHTSRVQWRGVSERGAVALLADQAHAGERSRKTEEAAEFLRDALVHPRSKEDVLNEAEGAGHKRRTIERAAQRLGVHSALDGFGGPAIWTLPGPPTGT